jgi:hypothetical protein
MRNYGPMMLIVLSIICSIALVGGRKLRGFKLEENNNHLESINEELDKTGRASPASNFDAANSDDNYRYA